MNLESQTEFQTGHEGTNCTTNPLIALDNTVKQSPISNSTDSTDILTRKELLDPIPGGQNVIEHKLMSDLEYLEQYDSKELIHKGFKGSIDDLKQFLVSKIGALVELISKYSAKKNYPNNFRWRFDEKKFIDRIENAPNKQKFKPILVNYFECQLDTVKAIYSDDEGLADLFENFTAQFKDDFLNNCSQDVVQELVINKTNSKRKTTKPESYVNLALPKFEDIEHKKERSRSKSTKTKSEKVEIGTIKKQESSEKEELDLTQDPSSRKKRNLKKISYCEDEKMAKAVKKRQKSAPKKEVATKKGGPPKNMKKIYPNLRVNMNYVVAYTWKERNDEFGKLLSTLSEVELSWFIERVKIEHPECISYNKDGINLKMGPEIEKDEENANQDRRLDQMKNELIYLVTFIKYIQNLKRDPTEDVQSLCLEPDLQQKE